MNCWTLFTTVCVCMTYNGVMSQESDGITFTFKKEVNPSMDNINVTIIVNGIPEDFDSYDVVYHLNQTMMQRFYDCLCENGSEICKIFGKFNKTSSRYDALNLGSLDPKRTTNSSITYTCEADLVQPLGGITCKRNETHQFVPDPSNCPTHQLDVYTRFCNSVELYSNFYSVGTQKIDSGCVSLQATLETPVSVTSTPTTSLITTATTASSSTTALTTTSNTGRSSAGDSTSVPDTTESNVNGPDTTALANDTNSNSNVVPTTSAPAAATVATNKTTASSATSSTVTASTGAESTSREKTLLSTEEAKGIDEKIIIIAASVGLPVLIAVIIIAFLLLRRQKRQKRRKSRYENGDNNINHLSSNNESSSSSQSGGNSGHNAHENSNRAGVELSSYTYATVIPSTKRNKFKVASDDSKNPLPSSDYSEVNDATNKNPETQNGFPGLKNAQAHYASADTGAYSEVRDSIIKNNTPKPSYTEIDLAHSGSNKSNTTSSSLTSTSDVNYAKLHEVDRSKQNPYDTFSGNNGNVNGPKNPRKERNMDETEPEDAVDSSTTETSNEYSRLHDIKRQEQNPYNVLPNSEAGSNAPSSPERFEKTKTGKTNREHPVDDHVSSNNGDEYSRLHEIQRETQNPYNG